MVKATYSRPSFIAAMSVHLLSQLPRVEVTQRRKARLSRLWRSYHKVGMPIGRQSQELREVRCKPVDSGEDGGMHRRPELVLPFLLNRQRKSSREKGRSTYPSDPCAAVLAKSYRPSWLERLKELIGLEEGPDAQRIEDSKCDEKEKDVLRGRKSLRALKGKL